MGPFTKGRKAISCLGSLAGDEALLGSCVAVGETGASPGLKNSGPFSTVSLGSNSTVRGCGFGAVAPSLAGTGGGASNFAGSTPLARNF